MTFETSKLQSLHIISETLNKTQTLDLVEGERYTFPFKSGPLENNSYLVSLLIS